MNTFLGHLLHQRLGQARLHCLALGQALAQLKAQAAQFIALAQLLGACCQRHLAFTHPFVQAVGAYAQAVGDIGHAVAEIAP